MNKLPRVTTPTAYLLPTSLILLAGVVMARSNPDAHMLLLWGTSLFLFTLSNVLVGRFEETTWGGYMNLAVMVTWLILGSWVTLALILAGVGVTGFVRLHGGETVQNTQLEAAGRIVISASGLLAAAVVYRLLGGELPLERVDQSNLALLIAVILVAFAATQAAGQWIASHFLSTAVKPIWQPEQRFRLLSELATLPAILVLPLIASAAGEFVYAVIVILAGVNGAYLRQLSLSAQQNAALYNQSKDLVRNLSVINQSVQSVLFNLNSEEALQAACRSAMTITQAEMAAIFVLDADRRTLQLSEQIGLNDAHQSMIAELPFDMDANDKPRVVTDTETVLNDASLAERARVGGFRAFVEMPLRSGHVVLGYLVVYHPQPREYPQTEIDLLETLANQVTAALDNAQLLRALELYAFEMTQLVHLSRISASSLDLQKLVAGIPDNLRHMMSASHVTIALLENGAVNLLETTSLIPMEKSLLAFPEFQAVTPGAPVKRHTFQRGESLSEGLAAYIEQQQLAALILVPVVANNALVGIILLGSDQPHGYSDREWQLIETATNQIAAQIGNARAYSTTQAALIRRLEQLSIIEDIVRQIAASVDLNHIISLVLDAAIHTTQADIGVLAMLTDHDEFWIIGHQYEDGKLRKHYIRRPKDQGLIGEVARTSKPLLVGDNSAIPYYVTSFPQVYQSSLAVPLVKDQVVAGVLLVESTKRDFFTEDQASFLKNLAGHTLISIDTARLLETLQYQLVTLISLRELSLHLSSAVNTTEVVRAALATAVAIFRAQDAAIFEYSSDMQVMASLWSNEARHTESETRLLRQSALRAAQSGDLVLVQNRRQDKTYDMPGDISYEAMVAVPIKRGGRVHEVMCIAFAEPQSFEESELNTMHLLASQAAGHLENATLHEQIRENNDRMQAILDSTRDGVILLDRDGRLAEANPSAQQLLGINLSDHVGEHFATLLLNRVDVVADEEGVYSREEATALARLLRLEPERITSRHFERKASNRVIYIEEIGSPVLDEHSQIAGRLLTLRDITEQKLLDAYREDITQMAVHDLRGPLASIINALGLTLESVEENNDDSSALTIGLALTSARGLMNLVDTILDIGKLERRQLTLRRSPAALGEYVDSALATLASSFQKAQVTVEVQVPPNLPLVNIDGDKVHRVFVNLLDNAGRYTPSGGKILVSVELLAKRRRVLVKIADSGPGIPPEERERIFEKYMKIESREALRGHKGSGLGLTLCKLVIEAHGERLWVEPNGPLPGACFAFTLPLA